MTVIQSSLNLANGYKVLTSGPTDAWYGPYSSIAEANATVIGALRNQRTVQIVTDEYWWKNGITDGDLILKIVPIIIFHDENTELTPDGSSNCTWTIANLTNSRNILIQLYDNSTGYKVEFPYIVSTSNIIVTIFSTTNIPLNAYKLVGMGKYEETVITGGFPFNLPISF